MRNFSSNLGGALISQNFTVASNKWITFFFFFSSSEPNSNDHIEIIHSTVIFTIESKLMQYAPTCMKLTYMDELSSSHPLFLSKLKKQHFKNI